MLWNMLSLDGECDMICIGWMGCQMLKIFNDKSGVSLKALLFSGALTYDLCTARNGDFRQTSSWTGTWPAFILSLVLFFSDCSHHKSVQHW